MTSGRVFLGLAPLALAVAVVGIVAWWPLRLGAEQWFDYMADDAFYYFVIADNLARDGLSSFDRLVLTNGYQPLWQGVLTLQALLHPASFTPVVLLEGVALFGAALLAVREIGRHAPWMMALAAALLTGVLSYPLILDGMETELVLVAFTGFVWTLASAPGWPLAVMAVVVVGARIDAAAFIVPALVLAPIAFRDKRRAFVLLAVLGVLYAAVNQVLFGTPVPVSGTAKSLGGVELNHALLQQLGEAWTSNGGSLARGTLAFIRGLPGQAVWMAALTALLLLAQRERTSFASRLALALLIGFGLYAGRLLFFSSWRVWEWYAYPVILLLIANLAMIAAMLEDISRARRVLAALAVAAIVMSSTLFTWREAILAVVVLAATWSFSLKPRLATTLLGLAMLANAGVSMAMKQPHPNALIAIFSKPAAEQVRVVTGGAPVGMSNFAGAFAYYYKAPVSQLEGLVNDVTYLNTMRRHQPIEPLLCARGVRYIVSYQPDIGPYETFVYRPLRPALTTFDGPQITFRADDEVLKISDTAKYGVTDPTWRVYVWRLRACGA